jgi:hypothetical protein
MADKKISALTASTTPLAGTEVLPIVQGGATVKVSVANLTTGRAISATELTLTTGNLIVSNGKGIDFSATPGTGTSELFSDYEEGTWTPTVTPATGSFTTVTIASAVYTKIGRYLTLQTTFALTNAGTGVGAMEISGLPFVFSSVYNGAQQIGRRVNDGTLIVGQLGSGAIQSIALTTGLTAIVNGNTYTFTANCVV